jgi:putative phosphoribosyl transferase
VKRLRRFRDRTDAGRALAAALAAEPGLLVLGLPRGGVPVAAEVARALGAELDVFVVRKLGVPWQPELAFGAIASGGIRVLNEELIAASGLTTEVVDEVRRRETVELAGRERRYREDRPAVALAGRPVVLVDDGLATGATMRAAVAAAQAQQATRVVAAVPVAPRETVRTFAEAGIELVTLVTPRPFVAVGQWYLDFSPVTDEAVHATLRT